MRHVCLYISDLYFSCRRAGGGPAEDIVTEQKKSRGPKQILSMNAPSVLLIELIKRVLYSVPVLYFFSGHFCLIMSCSLGIKVRETGQHG